MTEVRNFPTHPPTEEELSAAKTASIQSLPGRFETAQATAGAVGTIFLYDRPLNYYASLPEKYRSVTATDVAKVAQEDLHPDQLVIVAAGDRAKIEPALKDAGLGMVEVRDINGALVTSAPATGDGRRQPGRALRPCLPDLRGVLNVGAQAGDGVFAVFFWPMATLSRRAFVEAAVGIAAAAALPPLQPALSRPAGAPTRSHGVSAFALGADSSWGLAEASAAHSGGWYGRAPE